MIKITCKGFSYDDLLTAIDKSLAAESISYYRCNACGEEFEADGDEVCPCCGGDWCDAYNSNGDKINTLARALRISTRIRLAALKK